MARGRGRPSKLTEQVEESIVMSIRLGLAYDQACLAAGVAISTFYKWREKGNAARSGKYRQFVDACKEAEAEGERTRLQRLEDRSVNDVVILKETRRARA